MKIKTPETIEELQAIWNTTDNVKQELPDQRPISNFGEAIFFLFSISALLIFVCFLFKLLR